MRNEYACHAAILPKRAPREILPVGGLGIVAKTVGNSEQWQAPFGGAFSNGLAMPFQPGQSGNLKGRRPHYPPLKVKMALAIANRGHPDSLAFLAAVVADDDLVVPYRLQAAQALAPYQASKCQARHISKPIDLPPPTTVEIATANIAALRVMAAKAEIGLDEANDLTGAQKAYIEMRQGAEIDTRLAAIEAALRDRNLVIDGEAVTVSMIRT
jgi:hypothetical protein